MKLKIHCIHCDKMVNILSANVRDGVMSPSNGHIHAKMTCALLTGAHFFQFSNQQKSKKQQQNGVKQPQISRQNM